MKQAIGQGSADALVEEDEQGAHTGSLFGEAVGVVLAHSLQQAVAFHFAQVVAELIEGVGLRREGKSSQQGFPDLDGTPTEIGRASCRGRVEISVVAVSLKKKKK